MGALPAVPAAWGDVTGPHGGLAPEPKAAAVVVVVTGMVVVVDADAMVVVVTGMVVVVGAIVVVVVVLDEPEKSHAPEAMTITAMTATMMMRRV